MLEADGSLDATFADSGVLFIDFGSSNERGQSVAIDLEGRVLIAGYSYQGSNRRYDFALARINAELNNSAPIANDSTLDIAENSPDGTVVGSVDASDPDNDSLTFSIASGNELGAFAIDSATGQITVAETRLLDYESVAQFSLDVLVTDRQGGTATATVTVNVLNQASITGQVFIDIDQNGILDGNDTGIEGVAVELTDPSGAIVAVTTTNSEGKYTFEDLDPGTYLINELQPTGVDDGPEVLGNLGGTIVPDDQIELSLQRVDATDYLFAKYGRETVRAETADVSFWISRNGQELIAAGGSSLANWLTETFSNVFGDQLANGSGEDVAVFIKQLNRGRAGKVDAEFMALALSTYFSSSRISGSTIAAEYGFTVTDTGIGAGLANVGSSGAAFGVADGTDLTMMQLLSATNALTDRTDQEGGFAAIYDEDGNGSINAGEDLMRRLAKNLYASINNGSVVPRRAEKIH
ncbi:Serine-aspartate repeat-containing protein F precursor [Fuerstiella marisgermanici]|uniref:Serine-aspartate repeat-containing protein F n=1 Tax=Fuerstiella marisgermanici TaxID=1891926 RepID=A0A1P8WQR2_9PLAN|nr:Serine-aspartate repeat-containing protein F precursor [Fuerstiella marisgermanici]